MVYFKWVVRQISMFFTWENFVRLMLPVSNLYFAISWSWRYQLVKLDLFYSILLVCICCIISSFYLNRLEDMIQGQRYFRQKVLGDFMVLQCLAIFFLDFYFWHFPPVFTVLVHFNCRYQLKEEQYSSVSLKFSNIFRLLSSIIDYLSIFFITNLLIRLDHVLGWISG